MLTWSLRSFSCVHCLFDVSAKQLRGRSLNSEVSARETRQKQSQAYLFPTSVTIQVCAPAVVCTFTNLWRMTYACHDCGSRVGHGSLRRRQDDVGLCC